MKKEFVKKLQSTLKLITTTQDEKRDYYVTNFGMVTKEIKNNLQELADELPQQNCLSAGIEVVYTEVNYSPEERELFSKKLKNLSKDYKGIVVWKNNIFLSNHKEDLDFLKESIEEIFQESFKPVVKNVYPFEVLTELASVNKIGASWENFNTFSYKDLFKTVEPKKASTYKP
jgi:MoaA/NifB/PqqE/SkfB family radical SAM enzyme